MQSLELKGEIDEAWNSGHTKWTRPFRFAFHASRLRTQVYIDNLRVFSLDNSGFRCSAHALHIAFFGKLCQCTFELEKKNSLLCKLWFVTGNETVRMFTISKQKGNLIFCCLINIYQQTIELCKYVPPRLILSCRVVRAVDSCSLNSPNT